MTDEGWKYQTGKLDISPQLLAESFDMGTLLNDEIAWAEREMAESMTDWVDGPRLGPTRADYDRIMGPVWRKQRLVAHIRGLMPGKTAGRFVPR